MNSTHLEVKHSGGIVSSQSKHRKVGCWACADPGSDSVPSGCFGAAAVNCSTVASTSEVGWAGMEVWPLQWTLGGWAETAFSVVDGSIFLGGSEINSDRHRMLSFTWTQRWNCHLMMYWRLSYNIHRGFWRLSSILCWTGEGCTPARGNYGWAELLAGLKIEGRVDAYLELPSGLSKISMAQRML